MKGRDEESNSASARDTPSESDLPSRRSKVPQQCRCLIVFLYRNFLDKIRSPWSLFFELLVPVLIGALFIWSRSPFPIDIVPEFRYLSDPQFEKCPFAAYGPKIDITTGSFFEGNTSLSPSDVGQRKPPNGMADNADGLEEDRTYDGLHLLSIPLDAHPVDSFRFVGIQQEGCSALADHLEEILTYLLPYSSVPTPVGQFCEDPNVCEVDRDSWEARVKIPHRDRRMELWDERNPLLHDGKTEDDTTRVVFVCKSATPGNLNVEIRIQANSRWGMYDSPPARRDAAIPYDNRDLIASPQLAAAYAGSLSEAIKSESFLDYQALVSSFALTWGGDNVTAVRRLLQKSLPGSPLPFSQQRDADGRQPVQTLLKDIDPADKPLPEEIELLRSIPLMSDSPLSKPVYGSVWGMCLLCHTKYVLFTTRQYPFCASFRTLLGTLYTPEIRDLWDTVIQEDAIDHTSNRGVKIYCATPSMAKLRDDLYGTPPTIAPNIDPLIALYVVMSQVYLEWVTGLLNPGLEAGMAVTFRESVFPTAAAASDPYPQVFLKAGTWALAMMVVFLFPLRTAIHMVMIDKELSMRDIFKIFGALDSTLWMSIYIFCLLWFGVVSFVLAICVTFVLTAVPLLLVFILFLCFIPACVSFGILVSAFFSRGRTATIVGIGCYFAMFQAYSAMETGRIMFSAAAKRGAMLLFPCAFSWAFQAIFGAHLATVGSDAIRMSLSDFLVPYGGVSMADGCLFLIVDTVLYFILGWYFHQLFPGEFGSPEPWYFPFTVAFWCPRNHSMDDSTMRLTSYANQADAFEPVPDLRREKVISVRGLCKTFNVHNVFGCRTGRVEAVRGVDLDIYDGEIFALLGHNGAGKTTVIGMLTGMLSPTQGTGYIMGHDIRTELIAARSNIGFCPQSNILFDFLTVREHLILFGYMKGLQWSDLKRDIVNVTTLLGIDHKLGTWSKSLSGGQKRRLCVAMALIGGSRAIFLDEPSSGMDPYTRRALWDILRKVKSNRAIILTTHHMEEADVLGDRVAIMAEGLLRCMGSPLFLKSRFGVGYTLTLTKRDDYTLQQEKALMELILTSLPKSSRLSNVALEISFRVPFDSIARLSDVLDVLEQSPQTYGIATFSLCVTTLEEVFLKMGAIPETDVEALAAASDRQKERVVRNLSSVSSTSGVAENKELADAYQTIPYSSLSRRSSLLDTYDKTTTTPFHSDRDIFSAAGSVPLAYKQSTGFHLRMFWALLVKRAKIGVRDLRGLVCQLIIPVFLVLLMLLVSSWTSAKFEYPSVDFVDVVKSYPYANLVPQRLFFGVADDVPAADAETFRVLLKGCASDIWVPEQIPTAHTAKDFEDALITYTTDNPREPQYVAFYLDTEHGVTLVHDPRNVHSLPLGLVALIDCAVSNGDVKKDPGFRIVNYPLPADTTIVQAVGQMGSALWAVIGLAMVASTWGGTVLKEREAKTKHAQHMAGVSVTLYWLSLWLWDFLVYLTAFTAILVLLAAFRVDIMDSSRIGVMFAGGLLFGVAVAPFAYLLAFIVRSPIGLQTVMSFFAFLFPVALAIIELIPDSAEAYDQWLQYILLIIPHSSLTQVILMSTWFWSPSSGLRNFSLGRYDSQASVWGFQLTGLPLLYLAFSAIGLMTLTLGVDALLTYPKTNRLWDSLCAAFRRTSSTSGDNCRHESPSFYDQEDEDVRAERERVELMVAPLLSERASLKEKQSDPEAGTFRLPSVLLYGLRRVFRPKIINVLCGGAKREIVAVRDLTFAVPSGQCFGFLGINGAGKTTSMQMITGVLRPTQGRAYLAGYDVTEQATEAWHASGYCPQFDALFDYLTGAEHIYFYARLAGLPESHIPAFTRSVLEILGLKKYANRVVCKYSGGNKRKLSVGLAFLRNPEVVFLDEPSTGVDPASRRKLWNIISETTTKSQRAIMLTTHSMEECEALCDRLAIMQGGRLLCIGTPSHLKARFGQGYQLDVTLDTPNNTDITTHPSQAMFHDDNEDEGNAHADRLASEIQRFTTFLESRCPGVRAVEIIGGHMRWVVPKKDQSLAELFRFVEEAKKTFVILDYVVSVASLESVFVQLQASANTLREDSED